MNLKLDYKKTSKVGLAFAIICLFWNVYDFVIPLLIENAFGLSNTARGAVMGIDNLLSLFMLPWFGKLSDKSHNKHGRRTPFIVLGTVAAVVLMVFIPITASRQLDDAALVRDEYTAKFETDTAWREAQLEDWYDKAEAGFKAEEGNGKAEKDAFTCLAKSDYKIITGRDKLVKDKDLLTKDEYVNLYFQTVEFDKKANVYYEVNGGVKTEITKAEYEEISADNVLYNKYVKPGVSNYISQQVEAITRAHMGRLVGFLIIVFFVLIAMGTYRSPAVALMPDVTPKPLRSQANAIINLAGGIGGAISFLIYTIVFMFNPTGYSLIYFISAGCMLLLLALFVKMVDEPRFVEEKEAICLEYGIAEEEGFDDIEKVKEEVIADGLVSEEEIAKDTTPVATSAEAVKQYEKAKLVSFLFILASIFMWSMGYNAVSSNMSVYATKALGMSSGMASLISGISMGISAIAFIPVGYLAVKIGRRKSIMIGFAFAVVSFILIWLFLRPTSAAGILFTVFYLIAGFGSIIASVNTFPMVVELSKAEDVGKYTGFYYMATMSAQAITPALAGVFMDNFSMKSLFVYSAVCVVAAIVLMLFVKHGDSKPIPKKDKLEQFGDMADAD